MTARHSAPWRLHLCQFAMIAVLPLYAGAESMSGMKPLRFAGSLQLSLVLLMLGAFAKHPRECADCLQPHGFPFTYRRDGGLGGGAAFDPSGLVGDLLIYAVLAILIYLLWSQRAKHKILG